MKILRFVFAVTLLIAIFTSLIYAFPEWTFINRLSYNLFWAIHYSSFVLSISSLVILVLKNKTFRYIIGAIALILTYLIFEFQFNPFDTNEYPIDRKIISNDKNGKLIVREKNKGKSLEIIHDTVLVHDVIIFRKMITTKQKTSGNFRRF